VAHSFSHLAAGALIWVKRWRRFTKEGKITGRSAGFISQANTVLSARAAEAHVPIIEKPLLNNALVEKIREVCPTA